MSSRKKNSDFGTLHLQWSSVCKMMEDGVRDEWLVAEELERFVPPGQMTRWPSNIHDRLFCGWANICHRVNYRSDLAPARVAKCVQGIIDECVLTIRATDGKRTFDGDYDWLRRERHKVVSVSESVLAAKPGKPTKPTRAVVQKMKRKTGTGPSYWDVFLSYGKPLLLQDSQVIQFIEDWPAVVNKTGDHATHFFVDRGGVCVVVAVVSNTNHRFEINNVYIEDTDNEPEWMDGDRDDLLIVIPYAAKP